VVLAPARLYASILVAYAAVAVAFSWPLPLHFSTHLTGATTGDTGVYVWNQWVFQRELLGSRSPYFTDAIFSTSGDDANLALHNYSIFQNLLALPLIQALGVIPTFNLVMLFTRVLTAFSMFLLARHVTGRSAEAWVAGLAFAWSPALVTRSMAHFSLMAAAPLAVFLLVLLLCAEQKRWRWREAAALGLTVCWATLTDAYYGIYCLLLGGLFLASRTVGMSRVAIDPARITRVMLELMIAATTFLVVTVALSGGWQFAVFAQPVSIRSLYTPVLLLTVLVGTRVAWHYRVTLSAARTDVWRSLRILVRVGVATSVLLSPLLYAFVRRVMRSGIDSDVPLWRSSPRGIDLLSLLLPNPNHPLAPDRLREWLSRPTPDAYLENVASVPLVAIGLIAIAWALGWRPSRWWTLVTGVFGVLALGPFVHVAGVNTFVPGPWALLRYAPVIGLARTPARFSIVLMLGAAVLLASALVWITVRWPHRRRLIVAAASVLLVLELLPAPRALHSGRIPSIYAHVIASPPDTRVLHLPFGVRDGTASEGDFNAQTQYFQTAHGRRLIGGYLSRVSQQRRRAVRSEPVLDALMTLSENNPLAPESLERLVRDAPEFLRRANVGFIVVDRSRLPAAIDAVVLGALRLTLVDADGPFELYRPQSTPVAGPDGGAALPPGR
jgi:hypothetical protein